MPIVSRRHITPTSGTIIVSPANDDDYGDDMTDEEVTAYIAIIDNPWIPVSHSLPQKDTPVLIRVNHHDTVLCAVGSIPHGSVCWLLEFPFGNPPGWQYLTDSVIAWMPIPEYEEAA